MTLDLAKLKEAAEKATLGPWQNSKTIGPVTSDGIKSHCGIFSEPLAASSCDDGEGIPDHAWVAGIWGDIERRQDADATYIALANPATILALIERLESAEGALDRIAHECTIRRDASAAQTVADMKAIARAHMAKHNAKP